MGNGAWIAEYRQREGLALDEFMLRVNMHRRNVEPVLEAVISDSLIHYLERGKNAITHPRIANLIAEVCGATAEQRDMIVDEKHRGTWSPEETITVIRREQSEASKHNGSKAVVKVDRHGNTLDWYESVAEAVRKQTMNDSAIRARCKRKVQSEFVDAPYTFRYASEWDAMTAAEKRQDVGGKK